MSIFISSYVLLFLLYYGIIGAIGGRIMETALLIISILLIIIVLLPSGTAEAAGKIIQGGNSDLFDNRKERGLELFISRITMLLGVAYFVIALFISLKK